MMLTADVQWKCTRPPVSVISEMTVALVIIILLKKKDNPVFTILQIQC